MEKVLRLKSEDLGLAMLQTRKHAGKAPGISQRDHRMWKALSPKGLGEIEEIGKEEVSIKMMQALERFMRAYPAVWSESSVQHLLVEIADTRYVQNSEAQERLQTIINRILVPMAKIMEAEQGFMMLERQKIQEATIGLQRVQEEICHHALGDLKQEHDRSSRDLKELGKALEENRIAAEEAGRNLAAKEKQIQDILQKQKDLVARLVCGGPTGFVEWARQEIQSHNLADLEHELEHAWWPTMSVPDQVEDKMLIPLISDTVSECSSSSASEHKKTVVRNTQFVYKNIDKPDSLPTSLTNLTVKLLCLVVSEVFQQLMESYGRVKSPLSLPLAVAGFWIGLAGRMSYLALGTLFPQVMEKTRPSGPVQLQPKL